MLDPCLAYLEERAATVPGFTFEVLVVDDGSSDGTGIVVGRYVRAHGVEKVRLLTLRPNQGKGAAVRKGMLRGRGALLLMADADGATEVILIIVIGFDPFCSIPVSNVLSPVLTCALHFAHLLGCLDYCADR